MSADQVAEMSPIIGEVFAHAAEGKRETLCATIEVVGVADAWAQVTSDKLNVSYPREREPTELTDLLTAVPSVSLVGWEANKYATWSFSPTAPRTVAIGIDRILSVLFRLGDYSVDCKLERF